MKWVAWSMSHEAPGWHDMEWQGGMVMGILL